MDSLLVAAELFSNIDCAVSRLKIQQHYAIVSDLSGYDSDCSMATENVFVEQTDEI